MRPGVIYFPFTFNILHRAWRFSATARSFSRHMRAAARQPILKPPVEIDGRTRRQEAF
jgi:hypothetical protein